WLLRQGGDLVGRQRVVIDPDVVDQTLDRVPATGQAGALRVGVADLDMDARHGLVLRARYSSRGCRRPQDEGRVVEHAIDVDVHLERGGVVRAGDVMPRPDRWGRVRASLDEDIVRRRHLDQQRAWAAVRARLQGVAVLHAQWVVEVVAAEDHVV